MGNDILACSVVTSSDDIIQSTSVRKSILSHNNALAVVFSVNPIQNFPESPRNNLFKDNFVIKLQQLPFFNKNLEPVGS